MSRFNDDQTELLRSLSRAASGQHQQQDVFFDFANPPFKSGAVDSDESFVVNIFYGDETSKYYRGYNNNDIFYTMGGDDTIEALFGDDYLDGGAGADHMYGGAGNDTYVVDNALDICEEKINSKGFDTVWALASYVLGGYIESLQVFFPDSTTAINLIGSDESNEELKGNNGINLLMGLDGKDILYGLGGSDYLRGGDGNDYLDGGSGDDDLEGEIGNDYLKGAEGLDDLSGGEGNDTLNGGSGDDDLEGRIGNDYLEGAEGLDDLVGGEGNDTLNGGSGDDDLKGGFGSDLYRVDSSGDLVHDVTNSPGDTDMVLATASYALKEHSGIERLRVSDSSTTYAIDLTGSSSNGDGENGIEYLDGNEGWNYLKGLGGSDILNGFGGKDVLFGGKGDDELYGGKDDDILKGEAGNDKLFGDTGADTFEFTLFAINPGVDKILDFIFQEDTINLRVRPGGTGRGLATGQFHIGTEAEDDDDYVIYDPQTQKLFLDEDGSGTLFSALHFATVSGHPNIFAFNFFVFGI